MTDVLERLQTALADRYTIERELGRGGMAVVYLAHDLKHDRQVAVKVVKPDLAAVIGAERFLNEIKVTANLQHPNILPLFDSGETHGLLYYVMPYLEGESLRALLDRKKQLPIDRALEITKLVASALGHAHRHGVIHRDIKPENILLADDGQPLVADFGIALAVTEAGGARLTETGMSLGTPEYMSPEQAAGDRQLEPASDIYSLGAVLYEMLTGDPPHTGSTAQAIHARVMMEQPTSIRLLRETVPDYLEQVVMKALAKVPADRWQSADEMVPPLEAMIVSSSGFAPISTKPQQGISTGPRRRVWWMAAGAAAAVVVIAVFGATQLRNGPLRITTSNILQVTSEPGLEFQPSLSPSGEEVAYVVGPITTPRVVVRGTIDFSSGGETKLGEGIPGKLWLPNWTPDGASIRYVACDVECQWMGVGNRGGTSTGIGIPNDHDNTASWSPDGTRVVFSRGHGIFAHSTGDTVPQLLGVQPSDPDPWTPHSFAWSPDGQLLAYVNSNPTWRFSGNVSPSSIWIIDANGGEPVAITSQEHMNLSPQWLPDSRHIVFISNKDGPRGIYLVEVGPDGPLGDVQGVAPSTDPHSISLSRDGKKLAYAKDQAWGQNIWSIPIPRSEVLSIGDAQPVTRGNQVIETHDVSADGRFVVYAGTRLGNSDIWRMPVEGGTAQLVVDLPQDAFGPVWSPDGTEIAFQWSAGSNNPAIYVVSANGGDPRMIADPSPSTDAGPRWSPDGLDIAFMSAGPGPPRIWIVSRETIGDPWDDPVRLTDFFCLVYDWAPDGESLVCKSRSDLRMFNTENPDALDLIVIISKTGDIVSRLDPDVPVARTLTEVRSLYPYFSADGSEIYFFRRPADEWGIWSMPVAGGELTQLVAFDDPSFTVPTHSWDDPLTVGPDRFYLTISRYESDIWVMDLEW